MIDHTHRCLYVHIPKTGGNSVNRVFGVGWENHKDLARYAAELPPAVFAGLFTFAIVRNPWERLFSDYNYQLKKSRPEASKLFIFTEAGAKRRFTAWVRAVLGEPHRYTPDNWGGEVSSGLHRWSPQVDWISLGGRIAVDRVLRMERLPGEFAALARERGWPAVRLPHRNRRLHWHYSWYYDAATRDLVGDYYARDIAAFDYAFVSERARAWHVVQQFAAAAMVFASR